MGVSFGAAFPVGDNLLSVFRVLGEGASALEMRRNLDRMNRIYRMNTRCNSAIFSPYLLSSCKSCHGNLELIGHGIAGKFGQDEQDLQDEYKGEYGKDIPRICYYPVHPIQRIWNLTNSEIRGIFRQDERDGQDEYGYNSSNSAIVYAFFC